MAALSAYSSIVDEASRDVILSQDPVASAALQTGLQRNLEVLQAVAGRLPEAAGDGIEQAISRAIARNTGAILILGEGEPGVGGDDGPRGGDRGSGQPGSVGPGARPASEPRATPRVRHTAAPQPAKETRAPRSTPVPTPTPRSDGTPTPMPHKRKATGSGLAPVLETTPSPEPTPARSDHGGAGG